MKLTSTLQPVVLLSMLAHYKENLALVLAFVCAARCRRTTLLAAASQSSAHRWYRAGLRMQAIAIDLSPLENHCRTMARNNADGEIDATCAPKHTVHYLGVAIDDVRGYV
jgi:hypothetical protein